MESKMKLKSEITLSQLLWCLISHTFRSHELSDNGIEFVSAGVTMESSYSYSSEVVQYQLNQANTGLVKFTNLYLVSGGYTRHL